MCRCEWAGTSLLCLPTSPSMTSISSLWKTGNTWPDLTWSATFSDRIRRNSDICVVTGFMWWMICFTCLIDLLLYSFCLIVSLTLLFPCCCSDIDCGDDDWSADDACTYEYCKRQEDGIKQVQPLHLAPQPLHISAVTLYTPPHRPESTLAVTQHTSVTSL